MQWNVVFVLVATALGASISPAAAKSESSSSCGDVWITVHSPEIRAVNEPTLVDAIELNWDYSDCAVIPKRIGLFREFPVSWADALEIYTVRDRRTGYEISSISLGEGTLPGKWAKGPGNKGPHCLWPWVGAGDMTIIGYNCLKIQPTWMADHAAVISELRIGELAIPGTHNAGAWRFNTEISSISRDNFVLCQDRSIWAQLVHGIRYFDFRIAYYDFYAMPDDKYWLNHNLIRIRPLLPLLREIKTFLDSTTKEVVFLDAHHFPVGFYNADGSQVREAHIGLLELVQRELGLHLAPADKFGGASHKRGPPLKTFIDANKRLVFSYIDHTIVSEHRWLWPPLPHLWANTNKPDMLFDFLDEAIAVSPLPAARSPLYSAMAQTTPTVLDILFLRGSLRLNADLVNRNVTDRLTTIWHKNANIVATDFFLGNNVIEVAIALNLERGKR